MRTFLASALLLGLTSTAYAADCKPLQITNSVKTQPLADSGLITAPITLNGVEKRFLIDTGGTADLITQATVDELKLSKGRAYSKTPGASDYTTINSIALGTQQGSSQLMIANNPSLPFDGVVSADQLTHQDLDLDFGAGRVNMFASDHCEGKVVYWPHQAMAVIAATIDRSGHITVPVQLDGQAMQAIIDTGSSKTSVKLSRAQDKLGFSPDKPATGNVPKDDPEKQIYPRRFATLSLGDVTIQNPLVMVEPVAYGGGEEDAAVTAGHRDTRPNRLGADMVIGMDILKHLHVYLANREGKLYVTEAGQGESVLFKNATN